MIGYRYDDGGRAAAGFKSNAGDCVIRAIAILTGVPYIVIYRRMGASMNQAGYAASGDGYRQKARPGLKPRLSVRKIQNLVKASYRLRRVNLGGGPAPHTPKPGSCTAIVSSALPNTSPRSSTTTSATPSTTGPMTAASTTAPRQTSARPNPSGSSSSWTAKPSPPPNSIPYG